MGVREAQCKGSPQETSSSVRPIAANPSDLGVEISLCDGQCSVFHHNTTWFTERKAGFANLTHGTEPLLFSLGLFGKTWTHTITPLTPVPPPPPHTHTVMVYT